MPDTSIVMDESLEAAQDARQFAEEITRPQYKIKMDRAAQRFGMMYEQSFNPARKIMKNYDRLYRYYMGDHDAYSRSRYSPIINEPRRIVKETLAIITQTNPRLKVIAEDPQMDDAKLIALDKWSGWLEYHQFMRKKRTEHLRNKLIFGSGWGYVRFDPEANYGGFPGWPVTDILLPHNVVLEPGSTGPEDARFLFHIMWYSRRQIDRKYPWATGIEPQMETMKQPDPIISPIQGDKSFFQRTYQADGTNNLVRASTDSGYKNMDEFMPVIEVWAKDHEMWDFEPGFEQGGTCIMIGDRIGDIKPNMWQGQFPFALDCIDRKKGDYHGTGIIEDIIDMNDFMNKTRHIQQEAVRLGSMLLVLDPVHSGLNWDLISRDGGSMMRRIPFMPGFPPQIVYPGGSNVAGSLQRFQDSLRNDINIQTGLQSLDLDAAAKNRATGVFLQTAQEIKQTIVRPIAEDYYDWLKRIGYWRTYSLVNHIVDGPRRFGVVLNQKEAENLKGLYSQLNPESGSAVIDNLDLSQLKDLRWDIRVIPVATSVVEKQANMQNMQSMMDQLKTLPPHLLEFMPDIVKAFDLPNKEEMEEKAERISANLIAEREAQKQQAAAQAGAQAAQEQMGPPQTEPAIPAIGQAPSLEMAGG